MVVNLGSNIGVSNYESSSKLIDVQNELLMIIYWLHKTLYTWLLVNITKLKNTNLRCTFLCQCLDLFSNNNPTTTTPISRI